MMFSKCYCCVIVFTIMMTLAKGKRDFTIDINDYKINPVRPEYVKKLKYSVVDKRLISVEFVFAKNITSFAMHTSIDMLTKGNKRRNLLKLNADGCKMLQSFYANSFFRVVLKEVFRSGNIPKRCPLMENKEFYVYNFTVDAEHYPPITPTMSFIITVDIFANKEYIGSMVTEGEIRRI